MTNNKWFTDFLVSGLKYRLTAVELRAHLEVRAEYHARRRDEKQAELPNLEESLEKIKSHSTAQVVAQFSKSGPGNYRLDADDVVTQLKADINDHNNKAVAFAFLAKHLFDADYCLESTDLVYLEILK